MSSDNEIVISNTPVTISRVVVHGCRRTKRDLVTNCLGHILESSQFSQLLLSCNQAVNHLKALSVYSSVQCIIDTSKKKDDNSYDIHFYVKEQNLKGSAQVVTSRNKPMLSVYGLLPNIFGIADNLKANYNYGSHGENEANISFNFPFPLYDPKYSISLGVSKTLFAMPWCRSRNGSFGPFINYSFLSPLGDHTVGVEFIQKSVLPLPGHSASLPVRMQYGHSFRKALKHILVYDSRDNLSMPRRGSLVRLVHEFNFGDQRYFKGELQMTRHIALAKHLVAQCSVALGSLTTIKDCSPPLQGPLCAVRGPMTERFFFGGPYDLRGFLQNSIGLKSDDDYLGASFYGFTGAHLYFPLTTRRNSWLTLFTPHLFYTCAATSSEVDFYSIFARRQSNGLANEIVCRSGCLPEEVSPQSCGQLYRRLCESFRASAGLGLVISFGPLRLELNCVIPMRQLAHDTFSSTQFGFGVAFL